MEKVLTPELFLPFYYVWDELFVLNNLSKKMKLKSMTYFCNFCIDLSKENTIYDKLSMEWKRERYIARERNRERECV